MLAAVLVLSHFEHGCKIGERTVHPLPAADVETIGFLRADRISEINPAIGRKIGMYAHVEQSSLAAGEYVGRARNPPIDQFTILDQTE